MIKANLRRQIEMEEDRKAVRGFRGGGVVCIFAHFRCRNFVVILWGQDLQTHNHSATDRQTAAATERLNQG